MQKESILFGVIGLVIGGTLVGTTAAIAVNGNNSGVMGMMGIHNPASSSNMMGPDHNASTDHMGMNMDEMSSSLKGKSGDNFDKAFLSEMIDHHQGAVYMAILAKQNAKHDEIKTLANDIVTAQTKEITEMKQWQSNWGY